MKKFVRMMVCAALMALTLSTAAFAAPDEISIKLNGAPLTFTDAAPQIVNDRTYLPFRAVFTALGFADENITFEGESRTVKALSEELEIAMVIGENRISVTKGGQTEVLETDVPAFIDPQLGRTYVPAKFVSEAAGYRVGWDGATRTVIIDDVEAILAANEGEYTLLDKYLDYSRNQSGRNVRMEGAYATEEYIAGERSSAEGSYSMLLDQSGAYDMEMALAMVMEDSKLGLSIPMELELEIRGNTAAGVSYFRSPILSSLLELEQENCWFYQKTDAADPAAALETASNNLFEFTQEELEGLTGTACVEKLLREEIAEDPTLSAVEALGRINALLADSSFEKEGSQYTSLYQDADSAAQLTFALSGNKVIGYALVVGTQETDEKGVTHVTQTAYAIEKDRMAMESVIQSSNGDLSMMFMEGTFTSTNKKPVARPDEGAVIIDLNELE